MKKILLCLFCLMISLQPVFADDLPSEDTNLGDQSQTQSPVVVDITNLLNNNTNKEEVEKDVKEVITIEPELVNMTQSLQKVSAEDATGFKAVMLSLIGDYETTITDYEYRTGTSGYTSHSISIERDWSWLCSCGIFAIIVICTFKTIGAICSKM